MCLYFAYGSNMSGAQMAKRCPGALALGAATLEGHRLVFPRRCSAWGGGGVAGLAPDTGTSVEGVLWSVNDDHLDALDGYEGVDDGEYRRDRITVSRIDGQSVEAWVYFAAAERGGPFRPTTAYVATMETGAEEHGLSAQWVDTIAGLRG